MGALLPTTETQGIHTVGAFLPTTETQGVHTVGALLPTIKTQRAHAVSLHLAQHWGRRELTRTLTTWLLSGRELGAWGSYEEWHCPSSIDPVLSPLPKKEIKSLDSGQNGLKPHLLTEQPSTKIAQESYLEND